MKKLTKQQKEHFDMPYFAIAESLSDLYWWEADGFSDWTIGQLIELVNKQLQEKRVEVER